MPLINGLKMACEPCIRGHRSTKCTHANERLMVPVRKPGRPLSQCPHPRDQACSCGSVTVTAAIPRKQTCGCGSSNAELESSASQPLPQSFPQQNNGTPIEAPSPTRTSFKIQKSRPQSSRKQSFDPASFERMDMNNVNVMPFEHRQPVAQMAIPNAYNGFQPIYGYVPQYAHMQSQVGHFPMPPPPIPLGQDVMVSHPNGINGYSNGTATNVIHGYSSGTTSNGLNGKVESGSSKFELPTNETSSCCQPKVSAKAVEEPAPIVNGGSCCAPKTNGHSHSSSSSSNSIPEEPIQASCCAPKTAQTAPKQEPSSTNGTLLMQHPVLPHNGIPVNPLYQQFGPRPTVFTYPATYGSFQNPLQPDSWEQSMRTSNYGQTQSILPQPGPLPFDTHLIPNTLDTTHTCHCGETCSCIGCAAHPYNAETKKYILSAWESMNLEHQSPEVYTNGHHQPSNGEAPVPPQSGDFVSSPTANTPSSTNSASGEEQSLPAADFFFVNYPFMGNGCGGDTMSCPCGDDCQCLGCTIHNQDVGSDGTLS